MCSSVTPEEAQPARIREALQKVPLCFVARESRNATSTTHKHTHTAARLLCLVSSSLSHTLLRQSATCERLALRQAWKFEKLSLSTFVPVRSMSMHNTWMP